MKAGEGSKGEGEWQKETDFTGKDGEVSTSGSTAASTTATAPPPKRPRLEESQETAAMEVEGATTTSIPPSSDAAASAIAGASKSMPTHAAAGESMAVQPPQPASSNRKRPAEDQAVDDGAAAATPASAGVRGNLHDRDASRQAEVYTDTDCGITEYISLKVPGFHANIKQVCVQCVHTFATLNCAVRVHPHVTDLHCTHQATHTTRAQVHACTPRTHPTCTWLAECGASRG